MVLSTIILNNRKRTGKGELNISVAALEKRIYRVSHHPADLGWFDFDLGTFTLCPILLRQLGFRQNWLNNWARWWMVVNPTRVTKLMDHPVL